MRERRCVKKDSNGKTKLALLSLPFSFSFRPPAIGPSRSHEPFALPFRDFKGNSMSEFCVRVAHE